MCEDYVMPCLLFIFAIYKNVTDIFNGLIYSLIHSDECYSIQ